MIKTTLSLALFLFTTGTFCVAQEEAAGPQPDAATRQSAAAKVLDEAIETLSKYSSIQAKIRETVQMRSREFVASGTYVQASGNQLRMELKIEPLREVAVRAKRDKDGKLIPEDVKDPKKDTRKQKDSILQVSDGRMLWTQWNINGKPRVERRDLVEITKALEGKIKNWSTDQLIGEMGVGGVPALLRSLKSRMIFDGMRDEEVEGKQFVVIQGAWNAEQVARFMAPQPPQQDAILRPHLPEYVRLYFEKKTMFPRRILYLKRHPNKEQRVARPMVTLDFTKVVLNGEIDAGQFSFGGNTKNQIDTTASILKQLKDQIKMADQIKAQQLKQKRP